MRARNTPVECDVREVWNGLYSLEAVMEQLIIATGYISAALADVAIPRRSSGSDPPVLITINRPTTPLARIARLISILQLKVGRPAIHDIVIGITYLILYLLSN